MIKKPIIIKSKCNICEDCYFECPRNAIILNYKTGRPEINLRKCDGCLICVDVCRYGAIEVSNG